MAASVSDKSPEQYEGHFFIILQASAPIMFSTDFHNSFLLRPTHKDAHEESHVLQSLCNHSDNTKAPLSVSNYMQLQRIAAVTPTE